MSLLVAYAVASGATPAKTPRDRAARSLFLHVSPPTQRVLPGGSATYVVRVGPGDPGRRGISGRTQLIVSGGIPTGATVSFSPHSLVASRKASNRRSDLTIATDPETAAGTYELQVRARRPHRHGSATITLIVAASAVPTPPIAAPGQTIPPTPTLPPPAPPVVTAPDAFAIFGTLPATLRPGSEEPLDLSLENHESTDLTISSLSVQVAAVSAPRSDPLHPCGPEDFAVAQFSGTPGFTLAASSTATLEELGFSRAQWPQVSMVNSSSNQDGCQGASLQLTFAGTATEEAS